MADNERKRRDSERQAYAGTAEVRPSSRARMKRRSESEMQTLWQKVYQHNYMQSYHAHARWTAGRHTVHGRQESSSIAVKRGPPRKIEMVSLAVNRKEAPLSGRFQLPRQMYGHAACP